MEYSFRFSRNFSAWLKGCPYFPTQDQDIYKYLGLNGTRGCPYFPSQVRNISPVDLRASLFSHPGPRIGGCPYFPTQVPENNYIRVLLEPWRVSLFSHPGLNMRSKQIIGDQKILGEIEIQDSIILIQMTLRRIVDYYKMYFKIYEEQIIPTMLSNRKREFRQISGWILYKL